MAQLTFEVRMIGLDPVVRLAPRTLLASAVQLTFLL
jgi:hypothetical protein